MRGSIHQGGPDALMTGSTTIAARNRDGWPFRSVLIRLARRNRPIDRFVLDGSFPLRASPQQRRRSSSTSGSTDQTLKCRARPLNVSYCWILLISRCAHRAHHGCHGKVIDSIFQSVILHYQRTTSQHVRAVRTPNQPKLHTLVPHLISRSTRSAHATATDAPKSGSWRLSYAALRFSMTCRKFVANSP